MLIDDILSHTGDLLEGRVPFEVPAELAADAVFFREALSGAAVYALDEQSSIFLESLATDVITSSMAFRDIHLPHESIFIEYAFPPVLAVRQKNSGAFVGEDDVVPNRLGVLLSKFGERLCAWAFWDTSQAIVLPTIFLLPEDTQPHRTPEGKLVAPSRSNRAPAVFSYEKMASFETAVKFTASHGIGETQLISNWIRDIVDETPICLALLLFLNQPDKETLETAPVDLRKLNAARLKKNRPPMHPHTKIRLGELGKLHLKSVQDSASGPSARKAHFVRGHLMRTHGKMVWRRPHVRGVGVPSPVRSDVSL